MKAVILSAGQGSRLLPLTADKPKCLIEFSGRTLIDWQLDSLIANGIDDIAVVVGFRDDQVLAALARRGEQRARITTIFNPFYKVADNLGSVWLARQHLTGDCLILNGDTLVSPALVARALAGARPGINVTIDQKPAYDEDDMKVVRDSDGRLTAIGKRLPLAQVNAESIGMILFRGDGAERFVRTVEKVMRMPEGTTVWYLKVIHRIAETERVETVGIMGDCWAEVDFPEDLAPAATLTASWATPT